MQALAEAAGGGYGGFYPPSAAPQQPAPHVAMTHLTHAHGHGGYINGMPIMAATVHDPHLQQQQPSQGCHFQRDGLRFYDLSLN